MVSKDQLPAKFDLDSSYDQNVVVHVKHKVSTSTETKTVTQTINYVYEDDNTPAAPEKKASLTFTREVKTDEVTKTTTQGAWTPSVGTFPEVVSPVVDGYTPDKEKVTTVNVTATDADINVTVKYKADKQKVTYTVIDDTTNTTLKDKELLISGASDTPLPNGTEAKYDSIVDAYLAQGYELVSKDHLPAKFDLDSSYDQNVVIRLKHKTVSVEETKQVTMTVRYHGAGGQTPADKVQTATWIRTVTTDKVTGSVVSTTDWTSDKANYDAVPSPVIPGYTVDIATVPSEVVTQENIVKDVHYTAVPVSPEVPNTPDTPVKPEPPVTPSTPVKPTPPMTPLTSGHPASPATSASVLPRTGESQVGSSLVTLTGLGLLLSVLGLAGRQKKED